MARLLTAVSAPQADEVDKMKMELRRLSFDEQVRSEKRKAGGTADRERRRPAASSRGARSSRRTGTWRAAATSRPSSPPTSGRCTSARAPTSTGTRPSSSAAPTSPRASSGCSSARVRRLAGEGGDPVVQLQTNFGGGKTHSMLALYHLFSGVAPERAGGRRRGAGRRRASKTLPTAKRVVLVGNKISPGNPVTKPDGTVVRTLWGELAWQLGGKKAFARVAGRRREGDEPRRRAARAVQRVRAVPDPDRRVGGLRAPAPRPERPAGRRLRDAVHLRPGADRVGEAREATACW